MVSLLALLVVCSGSTTRSAAESYACLSNQRQVIQAWSEHSQDNRFLLRHKPGFPPQSLWGEGNLDWGSNPGNTNGNTVLTPEFRPYVGKDPRVFLCPSDRYVSTTQISLGWRHRIRSVSMNSHVGADSTDWGGSFPTYRRADDFTAPSATFVFAEEHPGSINDASFATDPTGARRPSVARIIDTPAAFHERGAHFGFADGHAELHRWIGPRVVQPVTAGIYVKALVPAPDDPDAVWLGLHGSQLR